MSHPIGFFCRLQNGPQDATPALDPRKLSRERRVATSLPFEPAMEEPARSAPLADVTNPIQVRARQTPERRVDPQKKRLHDPPRPLQI